VADVAPSATPTARRKKTARRKHKPDADPLSMSNAVGGRW
jgi:hypothetical protein